MAHVLVTDGDQRAALAVVRSLGKAGHVVYVVAPGRQSLAGASRHVTASAIAPDPLAHPGDFAATLAKLVDQWEIEVLLPVADGALTAILNHRELFSSARVPFGSIESVNLAADKAQLMTLAQGIGIQVPSQLKLQTSAEAAHLDLGNQQFPIVIKPSRSVVEIEGRPRKIIVLHAADAAELDTQLRSLPDTAYPLLLQQRIVGPGIGVFLLVWNGETKAVFSHRRIREKPPSGGVSVYRESIPADPALVARSRALLDRVGWQGVAMIEFKLDERTQVPYLMEINGRFWGSLQLALDAGVDFPAMLVRLAMGETVAPQSAYRTGVQSRWWWGDVDQLLARVRRSPAELSLPPGHPGWLPAIAEFARLWRPGDRNEILRWDDPMPFVRETINWFKGQ
jgi:predicted ATP-grasp superfamily ATP-dependent carboligase